MAGNSEKATVEADIQALRQEVDREALFAQLAASRAARKRAEAEEAAAHAELFAALKRQKELEEAEGKAAQANSRDRTVTLKVNSKPFEARESTWRVSPTLRMLLDSGTPDSEGTYFVDLDSSGFDHVTYFLRYARLDPAVQLSAKGRQHLSLQAEYLQGVHSCPSWWPSAVLSTSQSCCLRRTRRQCRRLAACGGTSASRRGL
mmetsp:Transcript_1726/g.4996  ORF Transcript_1726/g.4996 Transcript_1726/m.4996 type:complete len:204 (-) Transcript_1726:365-976(-)